jgi:Rrf2 family transcriptional regulator, cysteine metabolism repressor
MLTVSLKTKYGLTAMVALAKQYQSLPLQSRAIAETAQIPHNYLEQVLLELKKSALVQSFRGSQGGYSLTKEPSLILVKDIITCLEGPISFSSGEKSSGLLFFWQESEIAVSQVFELSLADLLEKQRHHDQALSYTI